MLKSEQIRHLREVSLFDNCSRRDLRDLASCTRVEQVEAGHTLLTEGSPSPNMYLLVTGTAAVRRKGRRVATLGPGDAIGELGVILNQPRNATVTAETPLEVLVLDRTSLQRALDDIPGLGWKLLQSVADRLNTSSRAL